MKETVISCLNNIRNILFDVYEDERFCSLVLFLLCFRLSRTEEVILNDKR